MSSQAEVVESNGVAKVALVAAPEPVPADIIQLQIPREWGDPEKLVDGTRYFLRKKSDQLWAVEAF